MRVKIDTEDLGALLNLAKRHVTGFGGDEHFTQRQTHAAIEAGLKALADAKAVEEEPRR